jgi:hypothetical protein
VSLCVFFRALKRISEPFKKGGLLEKYYNFEKPLPVEFSFFDYLVLFNCPDGGSKSPKISSETTFVRFRTTRAMSETDMQITVKLMYETKDTVDYVRGSYSALDRK